MLKILKKPMAKLLVGAMFISLIPTQLVLAADVTAQTTNVGLNANGGDTTTGAAVSFNSEDTTTGPAVNINEGDITAPVFSSISIDKKSATTGDILTVTVEASDDMSGIKSITVFYKAPGGSASKYSTLSKNAEGKYTGTITVGQNDAAGVWKVSFIDLEDNASNSKNVCNSEVFTSAGFENGILEDLSAGDFEINGTIPDTTEPVFNSISIDRKTAYPGEKLTVTVDASDDISGIKSITVFYKAPGGSASKSSTLSKNAEGKYTGIITVGQNDAAGVWKVSFIDLEDNASNSRNVCNSEVFTSAGFENGILEDLSAGDFEINGTIPDTTEPVFNSISIDKNTASKGEKLTVTVDASDDISGIKSITVFYKAPGGSASKYSTLSKNAEGKYTGTITVGLNDAIGVWKVSFIDLEDNASNSRNVCNSEVFTSAGFENGILTNLRSGDFEVNSTVLDPIVTPPPTPNPDEPAKEIEMPTSMKITGTEKVGNTLIAELLKDDSKFIPTYPGKVVYEWYRLDNEYSRTGSLVGRSKYYYLSSSDLNKFIKVVIYYNNKKINEYITSKITKKESSSSSNSSSGRSSGSSSGSSSSSSSNSGSNSDADNKASTTTNQNVPSNDVNVTNTAKVETNQDGTIKLVNDAGQAVTGWQQIDGKWYLADSLGVAKTGWQQTNGTWYLLNNDGVMATGWKQENGNWYLLNDNGAMATGWQQVNGKWYLLNDNGSMATDWQQTNGKWYYLYSDGSMATDTVIDGYRVDENGAWV